MFKHISVVFQGDITKYARAQMKGFLKVLELQADWNNWGNNEYSHYWTWLTTERMIQHRFQTPNSYLE